MALSLAQKILVSAMNQLSRTWKISFSGPMPASGSAIIAFWHGKMLPVWKIFEGRNAQALVSLSKDGEILSGLLNKWGFNVNRGSSSRGGKEALDSITANAPGNLTLITPDGPKGPHRTFKAGAVIASSRANVPVILCGVRISSKKILSKSWDNFNVPLPFSRIELIFSEPYQAPAASNRDEVSNFISFLESQLNKIDPE